jgi:Iron-containing redox enzyme
MLSIAYRKPPADLDHVLHTHLADFNRTRLSPTVANANWRSDLHEKARMETVEGDFIESERNAIERQLTGIPTDAKRFVSWFANLIDTGPGQGDPLFPWLAEHATYDQMRWFLSQEVAGEAGFEDLTALTQIKMPDRVKLEMASNYWDEMGRGNAAGMHGPMLRRLAEAFSVAPVPESTVWEALALGNLMAGLAANRRYAYQSIGALGVIELTAPGRAVYVAKGLRRLGVNGKARVYFELHATLDIRHSAAWNREVIQPLVAADPTLAAPIAEGALLRLRAGARCFDRYRTEFAAETRSAA